MGQAAPNAAFSEDELYYTDLPVGEILRRTRVHYGQSLSDIERALRIRAIQLQALEEGTVEQLPGRVYAIGFVRSYAEYLGLDGDHIVHLFKVQSGRKAPRPELHFPVTAADSKIPPLWLVAASLAIGLIILVSWWSFQGNEREGVNDVPEVAVVLNQTMGTELYGPFLPEETLTTVEKPNGITLNISQNSWVEIKDAEGKIIVSQVLEAGDQYFVPDQPGLFMSLGNAGGVQLEVDGQPLPAIGKAGDVRRDIPLDAEYLIEQYKLDSE